MKYYRLYITEFETESGNYIYGGKRHSTYDIANHDPYTGSGTIIRKAKEKYGNTCIRTVYWSKSFDTPELLCEAEELLVDILLEDFPNCTNLVRGGTGGKSYKHKESSPMLGQKRTDETKERMSIAAKNRKWTKEGLERRKESTSKMWSIAVHPDFTGSKNPAARRVKVGNKVFETGKACAEYYNISRASVVTRIKNTKDKWKEWNYE